MFNTVLSELSLIFTHISTSSFTDQSWQFRFVPNTDRLWRLHTTLLLSTRAHLNTYYFRILRSAPVCCWDTLPLAQILISYVIYIQARTFVTHEIFIEPKHQRVIERPATVNNADLQIIQLYYVLCTKYYIWLYDRWTWSANKTGPLFTFRFSILCPPICFLNTAEFIYLW